ncbi:squalene/phytoene synthase family protein [Sphingomonas sp.]|uniref:squalene/phytoene synthase family protein n=1 Tax=Sphingomonas sp. TaxID=28214 RepID=UPI001B12E6D6|nr:squalene/phytoene synthase family protein [Sphingomonas sp.]MBO9712032.1 squalene/phytoene synthase family protein [Sphingomonas sp.]
MTIEDPERALAISYAPRHAQAALGALFALDESLATLLRTTTEPMLGQMRLTWWRDRLIGLDEGPPPGEPVLQAIAGEVLPLGMRGAALVPIVEGWHELVGNEALDRAALERFAAGRGTLFGIGGQLCGAASGDPLAAAGQGWALADLARHLSDPGEAGLARELAGAWLAEAAAARWSRGGRAFGALAHLARIDLALPADAPAPVGAPGRVWRMLWHRLTGR